MLPQYGLLSNFVGINKARIRDAVAAAFRMLAKASRKISLPAIRLRLLKNETLMPTATLFRLGANNAVENLTYRKSELYFANFYGWSHYRLYLVAICAELLNCLCANVQSECLVKLIAHISTKV